MMRRRRAMTPDRAAHLPASAGHVSSCERGHAAHAAGPHAVSTPTGSQRPDLDVYRTNKGCAIV
eukprot:10241464-Lingulodinium_polyedra.AAC.1